MPSTLAATIADLGATGRALARLAAPVGERVDAFIDQLPASEAQAAPTINITINLVAQEEEKWPIN